MKLDQIKELMAALGEHDLKRLKIKDKDYEIELEREGANVVWHSGPAPLPSPAQRMRDDIPPAMHPPYDHTPQPAEVEGKFITSPMVGTFFPTPSPDEPPFVKPGDKVDPDTVVCIIEAMKVMNEVKAGISGTVTEVMIENGHPVEFGSKLFKIT